MVLLSMTITCLLLSISCVNGRIADPDEHDLGVFCTTCSCNADRTNIDCSRRGITELPDEPCLQVKTLNVSNNEISIFPKQLSRFPNLVNLDISGNRLTEIPEDAFQSLEALETLNLSNNYIDTWLNLNPNDILVPVKKLKLLDLSHNSFKTMGNLANQELLISPSLETLILENCDIDAVYGRSPLSGLANIKLFNLSNNPLTRIQSLISPTLQSLDVSNCALSAINHNDLMYLPALTTLKMSNNNRLELSSTTYSLFSNSLKYLDISYCSVSRPNLQGFPNLKRALLNHNTLRYLERKEFTNNTKLEYLDLSYNNIGSLKSDTFRGLSVLRYLDLSWNEIAVIPEDTLLEMPSLIQLKLERNFLTGVGHLRSMSVAVVDMSSCEINSIGKDSLEGLQSLVDINLSRNLISHIPDSISSNSLKYLNLNYNRLSVVNNYTLFMLPRLTGLSVIGNRFTTVWKRSYFDSNPYLERLDLADNLWRCDCDDGDMFDFYEFVTLEPNKKEESYNLVCSSPPIALEQSWLEACYFIWNPTAKVANPDGLIWFITIMIIGLALCLLLVNCIRSSMNRRLAAMQAERERQVEEARDRLRQLRIRAEQEALCNTPDPRDLIAPPSYDEALSMPKLNMSCHSLNEAGTGKSRRKRGRRKTKSSGDLLEETAMNGDTRVYEDVELNDTPDTDRERRRRVRRYGSHEVADLDQSPGARRRRMSAYNAENSDSVTMEVQAELERPLRPRNRRYSSDDQLNSEQTDF